MDSSPSFPTPPPEALEDLLLACRYGEPESDLLEVQEFVEKYGKEALLLAVDARGNTVLHMSGGNGHEDIVAYLLPLLPASALVVPNLAKSTPLHWIALNYHLPLLRLLCPLLPLEAFSALNLHGKTPVQGAEEGCESFEVPEKEEAGERGKERVRREEVVGYLLGSMGLGTREGIERDLAERRKAEAGTGLEEAVASVSISGDEVLDQGSVEGVVGKVREGLSK